MSLPARLTILAMTLTSFATVANAEVVATVNHTARGATAAFKFDQVPAPVANDLAAHAKVSIIGGDRDSFGAAPEALVDGKLAQTDDDPRHNFFFATGTTGGRVLIDLGSVKDVGQVNTYSWHKEGRGPQVYKLYTAEGDEMNLEKAPGPYMDPVNAGWSFVASVNTVPGDDATPGGQYGVSLNDDENRVLTRCRYLLLDISRTADDDVNANTFYSEIDVIAPDQVKGLKTAAQQVDTGPYKIVIDTTGLDPTMKAWAKTKMRAVCVEWYPKLVQMLPSPGFEAPKTFVVQFKKNMGGTPAYAMGNRINVNLPWAIKNKDTEGVGAVVHEMVHVVQQYHFGAKEVPFWLQEGIPDYIRWYLYEPQSHGARIRDANKAKYDAAYRISGNFLNWVTNHYDKTIVPELNAVIREGKYTPDFVKQRTGKTLDELNAEWKATVTQHD